MEKKFVPILNFLEIFLKMWIIFKSLCSCYNIASVLCLRFFGHKVSGILTPQPIALLEGEVSTTGPPGNSQSLIFHKWYPFHFWHIFISLEELQQQCLAKVFHFGSNYWWMDSRLWLKKDRWKISSCKAKHVNISETGIFLFKGKRPSSYFRSTRSSNTIVENG